MTAVDLSLHADPPILIVPGLGGSGADHWQTVWQSRLRRARRVTQEDWDRPCLEEWLDPLAAAVRQSPGAVLLAHSLGCALVAHLVQLSPDLPIAGAFLAAPADVDARRHVPFRASGFAPMPLAALPFPSVVVASTNDPYVALDRARLFAQRWGARFVDVGRKGHINVAAGCGPWPEGRVILQHLLERIAASPAAHGVPHAGRAARR
jgi:predicted alpha/beta hydrolase family esterase